MKEAEHVVVGPHQQGNGVGVRFVAGEHRGVDVAVRRNEREPSHLLVKRRGYPCVRPGRPGKGGLGEGTVLARDLPPSAR